MLHLNLVLRKASYLACQRPCTGFLGFHIDDTTVYIRIKFSLCQKYINTSLLWNQSFIKNIFLKKRTLLMILIITHSCTWNSSQTQPMQCSDTSSTRCWINAPLIPSNNIPPLLFFSLLVSNLPKLRLGRQTLSNCNTLSIYFILTRFQLSCVPLRMRWAKGNHLKLTAVFVWFTLDTVIQSTDYLFQFTTCLTRSICVQNSNNTVNNILKITWQSFM